MIRFRSTSQLRPAWLLLTISLAACGGSGRDDTAGVDARPPAVDAPPISVDAAEPPVDAASACVQQHLVCGRLGTELCGTCELTATCLEDQTGCLDARHIGSTVDVFTAALDLGDRFVVRVKTLGDRDSESLVEIDDAGRSTLIDVPRNFSTIVALTQHDGEVFWSTSQGLLNHRPVGGSVVGFPIDGVCKAIAVTDAYLLCLRDDRSDQTKNGLYRYELFKPATETRIATDVSLVTSMFAKGDTVYYASADRALRAMTLSTAAPLTLPDQLPAIDALHGVAGDDVFFTAAGRAGIWRMATDGASAELLLNDPEYGVIGIAPGTVFVRTQTGEDRVGQLDARSKRVTPLLQPAAYAMKFAFQRDRDVMFLGAQLESTFVIKLSR